MRNDSFVTSAQYSEASSLAMPAYLRHHSYRNRVAARTANTSDSSSGNTGFRCAANLPVAD